MAFETEESQGDASRRERTHWLAFYLGSDESASNKDRSAPQVPKIWSSVVGAALVEAGLSVDTAESVRQRTHMTVKRFGRFIPRSTLESKRKRKQRLSTEQSDRVMRIAEVYAHAASVFGDRERAERWMKRTNPQMPDERTPEEMLEHSYGVQLVEEALTQLEHGIPA